MTIVNKKHRRSIRTVAYIVHEFLRGMCGVFDAAHTLKEDGEVLFTRDQQ